MRILTDVIVLTAAAVIAFATAEARAESPPAQAETANTVTSAPMTPKPILSWETGKGKSYVIPALEVPGFLVLLNLTGRLVDPNPEDYRVSPSTM